MGTISSLRASWLFNGAGILKIGKNLETRLVMGTNSVQRRKPVYLVFSSNFRAKSVLKFTQHVNLFAYHTGEMEMFA